MAKRASRKNAEAKTDNAEPPAPTACVAIAAPIRSDESLNALFANLPADSGAAFVVTFRQEPGLASTELIEGIRKATSMSVAFAQDQQPLEPDEIYVARDPDMVTIENSRLVVRPASPNDGRVDSLLVSVAEVYEQAGIVVVMQGLGPEGATAVAATKRCGGFAIAEGSDSRPESEGQAVTATGIADLRVSAERIGGEIGAYVANLIRTVEGELRITNERLQATIEEFESTNEALKSSNEEYQSINEELQSANEELETSKAELQAVNEELQTVNGELAHRVGDLARANSDLKNRLESTQIATIFLDNEFRLRSFTPASTDVFHLIDADVGRPIVHISPRVTYPELLEDARRVLKTLGQVEREVVGVEEDRQFLVRVLPYRSVDNFIAGVVVTFLEITGTARAEAALRSSERRFGEAQELAGVGVWEWNLDNDETWWSPPVSQLWGLPQSTEAPPVAARPIHADDIEAYDAAVEEAKRTGELDFEWRVILPDGSTRWLAQSGRMQRGDRRRRMLGVIHDITEQKATETRLTMLLGELQHRVRNILGVVRSVVARTVRSATSIEDLAASLDGRLATLARTQGVFARTDVSSVDLEELVRDELVAVAAREEQYAIAGPPVLLRREAAEAIALVLHELTTNALKYGSLSEPAGQLMVSWRILNTNKGPRLSLDWQENGVRALDVQPSRIGFGRELIERSLPYELGADTSLEFGRGGAHAVIEVLLTERIAELSETQKGARAWRRRRGSGDEASSSSKTVI